MIQEKSIVEARQRIADGLFAKLVLQNLHFAFSADPLIDIDQQGDQDDSSADFHDGAVTLDIKDCAVLPERVENVAQVVDFSAQSPAHLFFYQGAIGRGCCLHRVYLEKLFHTVAEHLGELGIRVSESLFFDHGDSGQRLVDEAPEPELRLTQRTIDPLVFAKSGFQFLGASTPYPPA